MSPQVQRVIDFYEQMTLDSASRIGEIYAADAWFKDPFNEVRGVEAIGRIFTHMFRQVQSPRFIVRERIADAHGAMLAWEFHFQAGAWAGSRPQMLRGVTHLKFDAQGKVSYHRDYWDAAEELYMKLPVIGAMMRGLRKLLAA